MDEQEIFLESLDVLRGRERLSLADAQADIELVKAMVEHFGCFSGLVSISALTTQEMLCTKPSLSIFGTEALSPFLSFPLEMCEMAANLCQQQLHVCILSSAHFCKNTAVG